MNISLGQNSVSVSKIQISENSASWENETSARRSCLHSCPFFLGLKGQSRAWKPWGTLKSKQMVGTIERRINIEDYNAYLATLFQLNVAIIFGNSLWKYMYKNLGKFTMKSRQKYLQLFCSLGLTSNIHATDIAFYDYNHWYMAGHSKNLFRHAGLFLFPAYMIHSDVCSANDPTVNNDSQNRNKPYFYPNK